MAGKIIICQRCGKEQEIRGTSGKYCEECKKIVRHEKAKLQGRQKLRASNDTEEMLKFCLNCKRGRCYGECQELAELFRRSKA